MKNTEVSKGQNQAKWLIVLGIILASSAIANQIFGSVYVNFQEVDFDTLHSLVRTLVTAIAYLLIVVGYFKIEKEASPLGKTVSMYLIFTRIITLFVSILYLIILLAFDYKSEYDYYFYIAIAISEIAFWGMFWDKPNVSKKVKRALKFIMIILILNISYSLVPDPVLANFGENITAYSTYVGIKGGINIILSIIYLISLSKLISSNIFYSTDGLQEPSPKLPTLKSVLYILIAIAVPAGLLHFAIYPLINLLTK